MLIILAILDMIAGILLILNQSLVGSIILFGFGIFFMLKGLYSLGISFGAGYNYDWMGMLDMVSGILILLAFYGFSFSISYLIGIFMLIKGAYSFIFIVLSS